MKEFTWDDRNIYIIMEYCCGGDLSKYIKRYGRIPEKQVLYFLQQLASALKFLGEKGVVHMDLKPHNLLLHKNCDGKYMLKVADFGFAQHMSEESMRSVRGSPLYMAPEMLSGAYDARVDLWSVGVIMYECLFGTAPYSSTTFKELVDKIQRQAPIEIPPNSSISPGCRDLLTRLLKHNPDERISYDEFFDHEYLDLEYMPSKENYDKAVALIKQAIDLDVGGRLEAALAAYSESLRYLVPAVGAERDQMRRSALTAKLTRYMERAEEIKKIVKGTQQVTNFTPDTQQRESPRRHISRTNICCTGEASGNTYEFRELNKIQDNENRKQPVENGSSNSIIEAEKESECTEEKNTMTIEPDKRRGLVRFLRRKPVPYLNNADEISQDNSEKTKSDDNSDHACRIT
ncbi:serine/threonine-protein kinase ULK3-like isoform X2 [Aricia agestis]|nr:serine/threonine-protein kinase ULK3-like isoform X2 [Aricia agestis]